MTGTEKNQSGQITVFLSLMLILIISFLLSLVRFALIQLSRDQAYVMSEMAIVSLMGEFNTEAMEEYDLFLLDGSYRTETYSIDRVKEHYQDYISYKTQMDKDIYTGSAKGLNWGCELIETDITALELATDNGGRSVIRQLAAYMEDTYGISYIQDLAGSYTVGKASEYQNGNYNERNLKEYISGASDRQDLINAEKEAERARSESEEGTEETDASEKEKREKEEKENAQKALKVKNNSLGFGRWLSNGMGQAAYSLVVTDKSGISSKACDNSGLTSGRKSSGGLRKGYGSISVNSSQQLSQDLLFKAYLYQELNSFYDRAETSNSKGSLDYELEYILCGKSGDRENLSAVASRLLLMRSAANMAVLLTDKRISGQLDMAVNAVCAAIPAPGINLIVQALLKVVWSVVESVVELRDLFDGGKMAPVKTGNNWRTSADQLPQIIIDMITREATDFSQAISRAADRTDKGISEKNGLNYKQWLMVLIGLESQEKACYRFMDLAELNIHRIQGNNSFKMDNCITGIKIADTWETVGTGKYRTELSYAYQ